MTGVCVQMTQGPEGARHQSGQMGKPQNHGSMMWMIVAEVRSGLTLSLVFMVLCFSSISSEAVGGQVGAIRSVSHSSWVMRRCALIWCSGQVGDQIPVFPAEYWTGAGLVRVNLCLHRYFLEFECLHILSQPTVMFALQSSIFPPVYGREACFYSMSVCCILIRISVGGKSSQTTRLVPFSCFVGTGLLTLTSVREHKAETHTKTPRLLFLLPFLSPDHKKTRRAFTPFLLCPLQTRQPMTSACSHPPV